MEMILRLTNGLNYLITVKDEDLIDYFHYTALFEQLTLSYFLINNSMWMNEIPELLLLCLFKLEIFCDDLFAFWVIEKVFWGFLIKNLWFCRFIDFFADFQQFCKIWIRPPHHSPMAIHKKNLKLNFNICKKNPHKFTKYFIFNPICT